MEQTPVDSLLRSTQSLCAQLCDKETLDYGIAYYCEAFPELSEANQFREVVVDDPTNLVQAYEQAESWFRDRELVCHRWAPATGVATAELSEMLIARGFKARTYTAMSLNAWVDVEPVDDVRILPARAMRQAFRATFVDASSPVSKSTREIVADAANQRLNDPQYDMFVAIVSGKPAGRCALYQVGDIARVLGLSVGDDFSGRGVDRVLVSNALRLAKRLGMSNICTQISSDDDVGRALFTSAGFVAGGSITEFERDSTTAVDGSGC